MAAVIVVAVAIGLVVRNQIKVARHRQARAALQQQRHPPVPAPPEIARQRQELYDLLRPVAIANCELERFGEKNDGGYLMCANLLEGAQSVYSYGIAGYDGWGCQVSKAVDAPVHQYDCFDTTEPSCFGGATVFHNECVGPSREVIDGRLFDSIQGQVARNGDSGKRIVLKIDVETAEWDTFLSVPDEVLQRIDQMAVEFHWIETDDFTWVGEEKYLQVVRRLKQFFEVGHIHFNNAACVADLTPFPSWAYEVLFVSKRLARVDPSRTAPIPHPLDARNNTAYPECLPVNQP